MVSIQLLSHYGDFVAIFGFAMLVFYFASKKVRTPFENVLFAFSIGGLIADIVFTLDWLRTHQQVI